VTDTGDFDGFYRTNYPRVVLSLRLATGSADDAEDLAQEAFARTMVHWARVRGGSSPLGYVYRVAFRLQQRRRLRRKRQHDAASDAARLRSTGLAEAAGDAWSDGEAVREALTQLPPACRRAAVLCLYADMTAPEAAAVLGVSASTIRTHIQRARQTLVATLAPGHEAHNDVTTLDPPLR
jgi:RNA polymerase sigma-70 factor (ECF subfamily)